MHVVCTAGHVDHGKSALVRALTGMEPDRFEEERRRGLTIDLGFAWTEIDGETIAFVDLPGHERFIANMLAGAGPVGLALFVVAADEGWMPQSQEHLDILDLLGVRHGLVAVTKTDLVDAETVELAAELAREQLAGSAFANVDVVAVSARTGAGLDTLRARLLAALRAAPRPLDAGRPRLWVDRAFSITGAGTVVTGTLGGGRVGIGDELRVLPGGRSGRVRGLQTLQQPVEEALPGSRVAVNLSGLDRTEVRRGQALGRSGQWLDVTVLDAWMRALPGAEIKSKGAWHLHAGAGEWLVRVAPLTGTRIGPEGGDVRVELEGAAPLAAGDRFVLREAGRQATLGGGVVLDVTPGPRPRGRAARAARAQQLTARHAALEAGDRATLLVLHVAERGTATRDAAAAAVGLHSERAEAAAQAAGLVRVGDAWAHPDAVAAFAEAVKATLADYHRAHPVERAAPKAVALRAVVEAGCPPPLAPALLDALVAREALAAEGPGLRLPHHRVQLDEDQSAARDALLAALAAEPFSPPSLGEAAASSGASTALVRELEAAGAIVRLAPDLAVTSDTLDRAYAELRAAYEQEGPLTAARAKEVLGTSRKFALPLLEELDRRGRTRRTGDVRDVLPTP